MLAVHWLLLRHWCEDSVVSVVGLWSVLVELNLGVSHLVLILIHDNLDSASFLAGYLVLVARFCYEFGDKENLVLLLSSLFDDAADGGDIVQILG